jgi:hypothetical protein
VGSTNQSRPVIGGSVSTSKAQAPARRIPELSSGQSEALAGRIGTFLVLTDVHLDPYYGTTRAHNVNGYACGNAVEHTFGRVGCDSPVTLLEETIRRAHEVTAGSSAVNGGGEPDFILITGDSVRHEASYVDGAAGSGVRHRAPNMNQNVTVVASWNCDKTVRLDCLIRVHASFNFLAMRIL